jgi:diguanylate cyclase (GGDEF)-like protein
VRGTCLLRVLLGLAIAVFAIAVVVRRGDSSQVPVVDLGVYNAVYLLAALLCWPGRRAERRQAWAGRVLALALVVCVAGNVHYSLVLVVMPSPPYPSVTDALYLTWYPLVYLSLMLLMTNRVSRFDSGMWLDGLVAGLGAAAVLAAVVGGDVLAARGETRAETIVNLAYPVADLVLVAVLVAGVAGLGKGVDRPLALILTGLALTCAADVALMVDPAAYAEGGLVDLAMLIGVCLLAVGTTSAPAQVLGRRRAAGPMPVELGRGWPTLALPLASAVVSLGLLGVAQNSDLSLVAGWLAVACVAATLARAALAFQREVRNLNDVHAQARTDDLTGLPNRRALYEHCETRLATATPDTPLSLLMLDLDRFKEVNDALGHAAGDELLTQVGIRVRGILRSGDLLARLGGDEFALLLPRTNSATATGIAHQVLSTLRAPFLVDAVWLHVDASIGSASAPHPASTRGELLRYADIAMYDAKTGGTGIATYTPVSVLADGRR